MLKDEDPRVLPAVLEALRQRAGQGRADTLLRHLEHPDFGVRRRPAEGSPPSGPGRRRPSSQRAARARRRRRRARGAHRRRRRPRRPEGRAAKAALAAWRASDPSRVVATARRRRSRPRGSRPATSARGACAGRPSTTAGDGALRARPGVPLYTPRAFLQTRRGTIEIHLDVVEAPLTAASFVDLARRGFYDGLTFHRVEPGFVVQGGAPAATATAGPATPCGARSAAPLRRGAVGMALSGKDTGGSQFFITPSPQPQLDGGYTVFGQVVTGMDVVDRIRPGDVIERVEIWTGE